jgi:hypothetical protein
MKAEGQVEPSETGRADEVKDESPVWIFDIQR